jgi:hypothetical protein
VKEMSEIQNITMTEALTRLSKLHDKGMNTIIEDQYCGTFTIGSKVKTIEGLHDKMICIDAPRNLIIGVGGVYAPDKNYPGGARPIYRVMV